MEQLNETDLADMVFVKSVLFPSENQQTIKISWMYSLYGDLLRLSQDQREDVPCNELIHWRRSSFCTVFACVDKYIDIVVAPDRHPLSEEKKYLSIKFVEV